VGLGEGVGWGWEGYGGVRACGGRAGSCLAGACCLLGVCGGLVGGMGGRLGDGLRERCAGGGGEGGWGREGGGCGVMGGGWEWRMRDDGWCVVGWESGWADVAGRG